MTSVQDSLIFGLKTSIEPPSGSYLMRIRPLDPSLKKPATITCASALLLSRLRTRWKYDRLSMKTDASSHTEQEGFPSAILHLFSSCIMGLELSIAMFTGRESPALT